MLEILDLIHYFEKYGPWGLLIGLILITRRNRKLKRYINRHLPGILRSNGDSDLVEIKKNQELIMQHLGVVSCADSLNPTTPCLVEKSETWFTSRWQGFITARSAKKFINSNTRRKKKMNLLKSNLSKKLVVTIVATLLIALNDKFSLQMSQETIYAIATIASMYVAGQSHVDAKKIQSGEGEKFH